MHERDDSGQSSRVESADSPAHPSLLRCSLSAHSLPDVQVHASNALTITEVEVDVQTDAAAAAAPTTVIPAAAAAPVVDFVPSDEWQTVLPGQSIPPGLWVRVDMSTGVKTARLLPEEEQNDAARRRAAANRASSASNELALVPEEESESSTDGPVLRELPLPGEGGAGIVSVSGDATPASEAALQKARAARIALLKEHFYLKVRTHGMHSDAAKLEAIHARAPCAV